VNPNCYNADLISDSYKYPKQPVDGSIMEMNIWHWQYFLKLSWWLLSSLLTWLAT